MLRSSIAFFIIAWVSLILGITGAGGVSFELGRLLLTIFLGVSVGFFLAAILSGRRSGPPV